MIETHLHINSSIVHHISAFLILYWQMSFALIFVVHTQLDYCSFFNFNAIVFASATHVSWTNLVYHDSTIVYYCYHDCQPQSQ